jgi:hypothetical protein
VVAAHCGAFGFHRHLAVRTSPIRHGVAGPEGMAVFIPWGAGVIVGGGRQFAARCTCSTGHQKPCLKAALLIAGRGPSTAVYKGLQENVFQVPLSVGTRVQHTHTKQHLQCTCCLNVALQQPVPHALPCGTCHSHLLCCCCCCCAAAAAVVVLLRRCVIIPLGCTTLIVHWSVGCPLAVRSVKGRRVGVTWQVGLKNWAGASDSRVQGIAFGGRCTLWSPRVPQAFSRAHQPHHAWGCWP